MVVLGSFIMNFLVVGGAAKSFGILYVELVEIYQTSSSATLSVVAVSQSLCMLLGPIANMLALRYTSRRTVMVGGVIMTAGFMLSMFHYPSIVYLYFSYGLLVGVGSALAYSPSIVTVGQYFERRRALANGLSVAGSGLGNFAVPPLIRVAVDYYGFSGSLLILSGLMLHVCLAGALLRPPGSTLNLPRHRQHLSSCGAGQKDSGRIVEGLDGSDGGGSGPGGKDTVELAVTDSESVRCRDPPTPAAVAVNDDVCDSLERAVTDPERTNVASAPTPQQQQQQPSTSLSSCPSHLGCCRRLFDWTLLTNPVFLVYAVAAMLIFTGYPPLYIMLPDHARTVGINKPDAAFLVSILGLSDVVGRIGFGFVADLDIVPKRYVFAAAMSIAGGLICIVPRVGGGFVGLAATVAVVGLFAGAFFTLLMVVLAERLGIHRLHSAFGLAAMFMGVSFFYSAPITGSLKDRTGSWQASYVFSGLSMLFGAAVLLLDPLAVRYEQRKKHLGNDPQRQQQQTAVSS
jgi:MFS family permease